MDQEKHYKVEIAIPAKIRFQDRILPYLYGHYSFKRAEEISNAIIKKASSLSRHPYRGRTEDFLSELSQDFLFILFKEKNQFELKIIYYIDENKLTVYITDFFPTKMNPETIKKDHQ